MGIVSVTCGIQNQLTATPTNVTVSGNTSAKRGGGIANDLLDAISTLTNVTIADNSASPGNGGGFYNLGAATFGYVIVADSPSGQLRRERHLDFAGSPPGQRQHLRI